ncbi:hypothetical protein Sango_3101000 [Sesamum angolense]|uniref:Reverse transcriptase zinc-binding domain-containing protein n=1 Tax=Sesamum angolense TaxID=2727404 RepID=A0AAE1T9F9_9LAMI|nr:hypothetical protein Sango_3101000 [Sesamum angolense]
MGVGSILSDSPAATGSPSRIEPAAVIPAEVTPTLPEWCLASQKLYHAPRRQHLHRRHRLSHPRPCVHVVIKDGQWNCPMITDIACLEIAYMLPPISEGPDRISWKFKDGSFNTSTAYEPFHPPGPKVFWSSLLIGPFKIPKNCFILWLAIVGRLSTLDKPWLYHIGRFRILLLDGVPETHDHLLFSCSFSRRFLAIIRQ